MKNTKIEWCDHTFNPWWGCEKVSAGCSNCYAERMARRFGFDFKNLIKPALDKTWQGMMDLNRRAREKGCVETVFCGSMCDWLDARVPVKMRDELRGLIEDTPHLFWLLLTKRPENFKRLMEDWPVMNNVGLGVTVENQAMAEVRIPLLLRVQAKLRFVSVEPMLGPVDLRRWFAKGKGTEVTKVTENLQAEICKRKSLGWVICGAETGPRARRMEPLWAHDLEQQCARADVPFFFKKSSKGELVPMGVVRREWPEVLAWMALADAGKKTTDNGQLTADKRPKGAL